MANFAKVLKSRVIFQIKHNERSLQEKTDSIDFSLSKNNTCYNSLGEVTSETNYKTYQDKIGELKVLNRDDIKTMVECVVTLPKNVKAGDEVKFWQATMDFFKKRYGAGAMVGAYVHRDEPNAREHMHIDFIPIVPNMVKDKTAIGNVKEAESEALAELEKEAYEKDWTVKELGGKKKEAKAFYKNALKNVRRIQNGFKVSAKEVLTKHELEVFHPALSKYIKKALGYEISILNGAVKKQGCNKTRNEYKVEREKRNSLIRESVLKGFARAGVICLMKEADKLNIIERPARIRYYNKRLPQLKKEYLETGIHELDFEKIAEQLIKEDTKEFLEREKNTEKVEKSEKVEQTQSRGRSR